MSEPLGHPLRAWEAFYVIVGAAAGALAGLQFVVMTLIAEGGRRTPGATVSAFGTPNVVHFSAALVLSAILGAPWPTLAGAGIAVAVCGALGAGYSATVLWRARTQREYQPVLEDWVWHNVLPIAAYGTLLIAGATLGAGPAYAPFLIGAAVLLLVLIGIHNAWDTVTYVLVEMPRARKEAGERGTTAVEKAPD